MAAGACGSCLHTSQRTRKTERGQEAGLDYKPQSSLHSNPPCSIQEPPPSGSAASPSSTAWGPSIQIHDPVGDITQSTTSTSVAVVSGIHCRIVGRCCSSSTQIILPSSLLFLSVMMINPQLPKEDEEEGEIAAGITVGDERLQRGSDGDDT